MIKLPSLQQIPTFQTYRICVLVVGVFVSGCNDNSENIEYKSPTPNAQINVKYAAEQTLESAGDFPANIQNLPKGLSKNRREIKESGIIFLKRRRESNIAIAAIMGQAAAETENFRYMYELGSRKYLMYLEGRKDLGNIYPGDGPRYKGRGYIHLTGRANYKTYGNKTQTDLVNKPQLAERADYSILIMHHYLLSKRHGDTGYGHARKGNIPGLTKHINGGRNGYTKRQQYYRRYLNELSAGKYNHLFGTPTRYPSAKMAARRI